MPKVSDIPKFFTNPVPNGWKDYPDESTLITASSLQAHTDAIDSIDDEYNKTRMAFNAGYTTDLGATINKFIYFGSLSATLSDGETTMDEVLGRSQLSNNIIFREFNECSPYILQNCIIDPNQNFIIRQTPIQHCLIMASNTVFKDSQGKTLGIVVGDHIINGGYNAGFINFIIGTGHDLSLRSTNVSPNIPPRSETDEYGNMRYYTPLGSAVMGTFSDLSFANVARSITSMQTYPLLVIGNGTGESNRSNAFELDSAGDMRIAGDLYTSNGKLADIISALEARIAALEGGT